MSSQEPLGSPTRKTETHSLSADGAQMVSTKVKTTETTTVGQAKAAGIVEI